jgi:hypothetical protein
LWPTALITGVASGAISIGRLWLSDRSAPTEVLWAEDGLFALCTHKADFWTCLTDPFAGYLLFLPRVLTGLIAALPWEFWAVATNLVAALLAGLVAAFTLVVVRRYGAGWYVSVFAALLPVIAPVSGLEAINAIGSSYMLLLYLATLMIALPPAPPYVARQMVYVWLGSLLLLVTALTIPSSIVLLIVLALTIARRMWPLRVWLTWGGVLIIGSLAQLFTAVFAESPRPINVSGGTLEAWVDSIAVSVLTYWPGLSLGTYEFFTNFTLSPLPATAWLLALGIGILAVWLLIDGSGRRFPLGLILFAGLGFGFIPSIIGDPNNRYFVVPLLLWGVCLLLALDSRIQRAKPWVIAVVTALIALVWWPAMPASTYRATPAPPWSAEVARIEARCAGEPDFVDRPLFTPFWPPNWGDGLTEPTHPSLPCLTVWRWID